MTMTFRPNGTYSALYQDWLNHVTSEDHGRFRYVRVTNWSGTIFWTSSNWPGAARAAYVFWTEPGYSNVATFRFTVPGSDPVDLNFTLVSPR
jgi:hypothetical protein